MPTSEHPEGRGVLYPARLPTFTRVEPPDEVAELVRWFWIPEWDVPPGRISRQQLIAFPACNLVVEPGMVGLSGPATRTSHRDLTGAGWAVGALLRPAAVPAFTDDPTALRDQYLPLSLPDLHRRVAHEMTQPQDSGKHRVRAVAEFAAWLGARVAAPGEPARLANAMAARIDSDPDLVTLGDVAAALHVSPRTLQRLARVYVGLTPSAMIRRRRLQEAAAHVREHPDADLARIAADLGYADQAHLARDFRTVLGFTASGYRHESASG